MRRLVANGPPRRVPSERECALMRGQLRRLTGTCRPVNARVGGRPPPSCYSGSFTLQEVRR